MGREESPELRRRLKILSEFLQGLPLVEMRPDSEVVARAGGVGTHALSSAGGEYAIYVDGNGPLELSLNLPAGRYEVWWVNVLSGQKTVPWSFQHAGGTRRIGSGEFEKGIALRISRRESRK